MTSPTAPQGLVARLRAGAMLCGHEMEDSDLRSLADSAADRIEALEACLRELVECADANIEYDRSRVYDAWANARRVLKEG